MSEESATNRDTSRVPVAAFMALSLAAFASSTSLRVTDPLLPNLAAGFSVPLGRASMVITAFSIAYGLSQLFFGPVGDRFGKYVVIAWACIAGAMASVFCGLAPTFNTLVIARLLAGGTAAAVIPLSLAWIGDVVPYENRQPVLARFLIGQILGVSAGVLLGGLAADFLGWRTPFFVIGALFVGVSVVLFGLNRRLPSHARATRPGSGSAIRRVAGEFGQVLAKPWARVLLLTIFLEGACVFGAFAFIALHLHTVHGVSLSMAGSLVMLFGFGGVLFAGTAGILVRRLGEVGLSLWGGVVLSASFLVVALASVWWWAIPACFLAGLGFYMLHNTLQTNATQMAPERRGAAVAAFASCYYMGQSAGVGLGGAIVERAGTRAVIVAGAIGVLLIGIVFSRLRARSLEITARPS